MIADQSLDEGHYGGICVRFFCLFVCFLGSGLAIETDVVKGAGCTAEMPAEELPNETSTNVIQW